MRVQFGSSEVQGKNTFAKKMKESVERVMKTTRGFHNQEKKKVPEKRARTK